MGNFHYERALLLTLFASSAHGWGGGGYYYRPSAAPVVTVTEAAYTTANPVYTPANPVYTPVYTPPNPVQSTLVPNPVQSTLPANPETGSPDTTQAYQPTSTGPDVGVSTEAANPTSTGTAQPSGSSTPNSCGSNVQKISLDNQSGNTLVIQAGPPWTVGECGSIASGTTCTFCQVRASTGGNLQIGYGTANARGTWIEGNWVTTAEWATVDISFIPGYSVPISCTSDLTGATNGWGSPLCTDADCSNCNGGGGSWDGNACENPAGAANNPIPDGPCPSFYSSSAAGAYCFPNDNGVVGFGQPWSSVSCTAGPQSGGGSNTKRDINETLVVREVEERDSILKVRGASRIASHRVARAHARSLKNLLS